MLVVEVVVDVGAIVVDDVVDTTDVVAAVIDVVGSVSVGRVEVTVVALAPSDPSLDAQAARRTRAISAGRASITPRFCPMPLPLAALVARRWKRERSSSCSLTELLQPW